MLSLEIILKNYYYSISSSSDPNGISSGSVRHLSSSAFSPHFASGVNFNILKKTNGNIFSFLIMKYELFNSLKRYIKYYRYI